METKTCKKCGLPKELTAFYKKKTGLCGVGAVCKDCTLQKAKAYYTDNKEAIQAYKATYAVENKDAIAARQKSHRAANKERYAEYAKQYQTANAEATKAYGETYRALNRDKHREYMREYFQNNKEKHYAYYKQRKIDDPLFRLSCSIRTLISTSFTNNYTRKAKRTTAILGCSFEQFKAHIEAQFTPDMSWDNYGSYWEFDHIKPISLAKTEAELYKLNHYTNFQPLYWADNISKSNKYGPEDIR